MPSAALTSERALGPGGRSRTGLLGGVGDGLVHGPLDGHASPRRIPHAVALSSSLEEWKAAAVNPWVDPYEIVVDVRAASLDQPFSPQSQERQTAL
jgi:hypothetical protein